MDLAAHSLWVGAALVVLFRRTNRPGDDRPGCGSADRAPPGRGVVVVTLLAALLPDLVHVLPVALWALADGGWSGLLAYGTALPDQEPDMPAWTGLASHHLHCFFHSALVALGIHLSVLLLWWAHGRKAGRISGLPWRLALPLWAWWSHILIDVLTHSDDFYPSPVLYPVTYAGFDGVAWNRPGFMLLNYLALGLTWAWLFRPGRQTGR